MTERFIGKVKDYFKKVGVMALELEGPLKVGETIRVEGHTTDLTQKIDSMQIEREDVQEAGPGEYVGIKISERTRPGDSVYVVEEEGA
jgi:translation initiation factor IF-2